MSYIKAIRFARMSKPAYYATSGGGVRLGDTETDIALPDGQMLTILSSVFGSEPRGGGDLTFSVGNPSKGRRKSLIFPSQLDAIWATRHMDALRGRPEWAALETEAKRVYASEAVAGAEATIARHQLRVARLVDHGTVIGIKAVTADDSGATPESEQDA